MKCGKKFTLKHPKSKLRCWCKGLVWSLFLSFGIINFGCDKNDSDEYYVKYEVDSSTIYFGGRISVEISTEKSNNMTFTIDTGPPWETVIGPVQKGFLAKLGVNKVGSPDSQLRLYAKISVSKNGSPFALKLNDGSETPRNSLQISYEIDF